MTKVIFQAQFNRGVSGDGVQVSSRHRVADPGAFFVKTAKMTCTNAAYDQNTFYEAWRPAIQHYGIFNPWTGRGAIKGLFPHGPHNVRDALATPILKQTGSYEQASYAIRYTPKMVALHHGRFLPQDRAEIAASRTRFGRPKRLFPGIWIKHAEIDGFIGQFQGIYRVSVAWR